MMATVDIQAMTADVIASIERTVKSKIAPRADADRLADAAEEAYAAMDDPSNNFNDTGDGLLMERLRAAIDGYRKAATQ